MRDKFHGTVVGKFRSSNVPSWAYGELRYKFGRVLVDLPSGRSELVSSFDARYCMSNLEGKRVRAIKVHRGPLEKVINEM